VNFFDDWAGIARVVVFAPLAYAALVALLRVSGKRTLAKLNAFDLIVTVALGSILATATLNAGVPLLESIVASGALIGLQALVAWAEMRWARVAGTIRSEPRLVARGGRMLRGAMRRERLSEADLLQALRSSGQGRLADVDAVVLETDGSLSVIGSADTSDAGSLRNVAT
jgi:uncharacterized membrane protein YcaP (DUF421 family)